jgi:hypothetical protein
MTVAFALPLPLVVCPLCGRLPAPVPSEVPWLGVRLLLGAPWVLGLASLWVCVA